MFVKFVDLGQRKAGDVYEDLPFEHTQTVDGSADPITQSEMLLADWDVMRDLIFERDPDTWVTEYKMLGYEEAERYGLDVKDLSGDTARYPVARDGSRLDLDLNVVAGTVWEAGGLKLPANLAQFGLESFGAFTWWGNYSPFKITATPSYAAPAVEDFQLQKGDIVFLTPNLNRLDAESQDADPTVRDHLVGPYRHLQREFWLERNWDGTGYPALSIDLDTAFGPTDVATLKVHIRHNARAFEWDDVNSEWDETVDPADFPQYADSGTVIFDGAWPLLKAGTFVGAVRRGSQMRYFWCDVDDFGITALRTISIV